MADEAASSTMGHRTGEASSQYEKDMLFIHPSEHSQLALTSSPLDGTNFLVWQRAVYVSLGTKMKLGFIDGSFSKPGPGSLIFEQWRRVDLMVTSWLWNFMSKDIVESFMYCSTSRELWLAVQARYGRSNGPLIYQLQRELSSVAQQDLSLTAYLTKVMKLWNELNCLAPPPRCKCGGCTCGINEEIDQLASLTQLMQFLMGLHERMIHTSMEMNTNNVAYQLFSKGSKRDDGKYAQKQRITAAERRTVVCSHCRKPGHGQDTCFQLHGIPDWYKSLNEKKKKGRAFMANIDVKDEGVPDNATRMMTQLIQLLTKANAPSDPITSHANFAQFEEEFAGNTAKPIGIDLSFWIIDTGATNHVCANIASFHSFAKPATPHFIHLPDGSKNAVTYVSNVQLNDEITLHNVFFVPQFSVNLISVSQLCAHTSFQLLFTKESCFLQDQDSKKSLAIAHLFKNLYIFRPHPSFASAMDSVGSGLAMSCTQSNNQTLWHQRLGHASLQAVKHFKNIVFSVDNDKTPCDVCHKAMQSRVPFPVSSSYSGAPFELVHMDLWGPYAASNLLGGTYVLTLLDDYSRCLWTFILKQKSQVPRTIKTLRSDNGSEFFNHDCQTLCSDLGIIHRSSCTCTPQQNGRVERKHRHLLNVARPLLFQASLPIRF
ncbi:UNVERIFIED_CONTAM: hypothetical protein Sindi_2852600 [Sesamum indicum]